MTVDSSPRLLIFLYFASAHQPQAKEKERKTTEVEKRRRRRNGGKKRMEGRVPKSRVPTADEVVASWRGSCLLNAIEAMHIECVHCFVY